MKLNFIELYNIVYYREPTKLIFDKGLIYIQGLNKNSRDMENTNAVGKSLLLACIPHLCFNDPVKSGKKKNTLFKKGSKIIWDFILGGVHYNITKYKTTKMMYTILKNGQDLGFNTATEAETFISNLIPLNEWEFYTTVYLDSTKVDEVKTGTSSSRLTYIINLFQLHDFEKIKKFFTDELKKCGDDKIRAETLTSSQIPYDWVHSYCPDSANARLTSIQSDINSLKQKKSNVTKVASLLRLYLKHYPDIQEATKYNEVELTRYKQLNAQLDYYNRNLLAIDTYNSEYANWLLRYNNLRHQLNLSESIPVSDLNVRLNKLKADELNLIQSNQQEMKQYKSAQARLVELDQKNKYYNSLVEKAILEYPDILQLDLESLKEELTLARVKLQSIYNQIEGFNNFRENGGKCSQCGNPATKEHITKEKDVLLSRYNVDLDNFNKQKLLYDKRVYLDTLWDNVLEDELLSVSKVKPVDPLHPKYTLLNPISEPPPKPQHYDKPDVSLSEVSAKINELEKSKLSYGIIERNKTEINQAEKLIHTEMGLKSVDEINHEITKADNLSYELNNQVHQLEIDAINTQQELDKYYTDKNQFDLIDRQIKLLEDSIKQSNALVLLIDACGKKGAQLVTIGKVAKVIENNLNKYSNLIFPENMNFEIDIAPNKFDINVTRKDGTKSDIRYLSGAETRMFSLAWMISILPLIPKERRFNYIILDEFEAGISESGRYNLIEDFLPELTKLVDTVIFLTPNKVNESPSRKVYTVVKEGNKSTLIKGNV